VRLCCWGEGMEGAEAETREGRKARDPGEGSRKRKRRTRTAEMKRKSESERRKGRLARSEDGTAIAAAAWCELRSGRGEWNQHRRRWKKKASVVVGFGRWVGGVEVEADRRGHGCCVGGRGGRWRAGGAGRSPMVGRSFSFCLIFFFHREFAVICVISNGLQF
jgi:hypothetical protein